MESFHPSIMERIDQLGQFAQRAGPDEVGSSRARSFDSFATDVSGWRQHYDFLGGGQFCGYTSDVWLNGIQIYREASAGHLAVSGETWPGSLFFAIPYRQLEPARINGLEVKRGDAFVYFGGRDWHIRTPAAWSVLSIALPAPIFEDLPLIDELRRLARYGAVLHDFLPSSEFESILRGSALLADTNFSGVHEAITAQLETLVTTAISGALEASFSRDAPRRKYYRAYAVADREIRELRDSALTAASSKQVLAIIDRPRYRSLHNHVKTVFDCSPQQYVEAVKLNAIRRDLKRGAATVLDTAAKYGMWHGGRLASQYAQVFGERPSETKRE